MDIGSITSGFSIAKSGYETLQFIRDIAGADVISGYFKNDCTRIEGSQKIEVELHPSPKNKAIWWYSVKPIDDYIFTRMPLVESCAHEIIGQKEGEAQPDAQFWRWVAPTLPGRLYGGEAVNLKVDFLVFGYKPKALIRYFSSR